MLAAGLVLAALVLAPGLGFLSRMIGPSAANPFALTPTQFAALRETLWLMLGVAVFTALIGVSTAWLVSVHEFPLRRALDIGLVLPLAFPTYLVAYVAVDLLDFFGPVQSALRAFTGYRLANEYWFPNIRSLPGAIILLSLVLMPYVYVPCRILFTRSGRNIVEAARLLGASGWRLFFRIGLPIAKPAIMAGVVLALLETLNDIGAVEYLGVSSLSAVIRDLWLNRFDLAGAARLAGLLIAIVVLLLLINPQSRAGFAPRTGRPLGERTAPRCPVGLDGWRGHPFLPPAGRIRLCHSGAASGLARHPISGRTQGRYRPVSGDFCDRGPGAGGQRRGDDLRCPDRGRPAPDGAFSRISPLTMLGYATPGTVLVLAIMPVLATFDDALVKVGLPALFIGANAAVIYALSTRFLGIGTTQAGLALARLPANVDAVARVHGYGDIRLATRIHWPAIQPGLKLGAILVFIDTVKELPATLLLRPLNVETLATRAYARASAGMFEHGALDSLLIVAISALAAIALSRRS